VVLLILEVLLNVERGGLLFYVERRNNPMEYALIPSIN
jgi:hypothetical protein